MASITMGPLYTSNAATSDVTGDERILIINTSGKPSTIKVNQILDRIDDEIVDRIDDQVIDKVEDQIDDIIEDRLENVDISSNLKWNEVK